MLGQNGAGKSTTLLTLAGHLRPLSGTITISGKAVSGPPHTRAQEGLAFVPEGRSVFGGLSTRDNLRVGRCEVDDATALFPELKPLLGRPAGKLSGGEQQMLSLGRALARHPDLLLADELSLGLAPLVVTRLLEAVRAAADERGMGVLLVEQHVQQALRYADRIYILRRGTIVRSGTVAEVTPYLEEAYLTGPDGDALAAASDLSGPDGAP
jgi:branched-chain amino acid transport system ATP-binding protein